MKRVTLAALFVACLVLFSGCPRRTFGGPVCGNAYCEDGESAISCPGDCGGGTGWTCTETFYGTDDGCDCGCSIPDPDCGGLGCTTPSCSSLDCDYCYDAAGTSIGCGNPGPVCGDGVCDPGEAGFCAPDCPVTGWTCATQYNGTGDGCDCGCGVPDPDCGGLGCSTPSCMDTDCDYCWDGADKQVSCGGPPAMCPNNNCADLSGSYVCDNGTCVCASGCQPFGSSVCCGFPFCSGDCIGNPCC